MKDAILLGVSAVQDNSFLLLYEQLEDSYRLFWQKLNEKRDDVQMDPMAS